MEMPSWLPTAVARSEATRWTVAYALAAYCERHSLSREALAAELECSEVTLCWLSLCRRPRPGRWSEDLALILQRFPANGRKLEEALRGAEGALSCTRREGVS